MTAQRPIATHSGEHWIRLEWSRRDGHPDSRSLAAAVEACMTPSRSERCDEADVLQIRCQRLLLVQERPKKPQHSPHLVLVLSGIRENRVVSTRLVVHEFNWFACTPECCFKIAGHLNVRKCGSAIGGLVSRAMEHQYWRGDSIDAARQFTRVASGTEYDRSQIARQSEGTVKRLPHHGSAQRLRLDRAARPGEGGPTAEA